MLILKFICNISTSEGGGEMAYAFWNQNFLIKFASLMCCSPWGHKEVDMTERLNNNYLYEFKSKVDLSLSLKVQALHTGDTDRDTFSWITAGAK